MEIKEIRNKIAAVWRELEDMKKKNEDEGKAPTFEERTKASELLDEIDRLEEDLSNAELEYRIKEKGEALAKSRREVQKQNLEKKDKRGFQTFGEFLQAVVGYYAAGGLPDPRLLAERETRAATGLSEGTPSDGGFLVQTDFSAGLLQRAYTTGMVISRANKIPISATANGLKINAIAETSRAAGSRWGGILAYWAAEAGTKTASAPKFRQMELSLKKLIGLCYATDELLQDAAALEAVVMQGFGSEFGFQLDDVAINGTGVGQPLGILNSGCLVTVNRATASTIVAADIINMWARCYAPSRINSVWFINQDVEPALYQTYVATGTYGGQVTYVPPGGLSSAPYATLMGRPVIPIEQCASYGTKGDIILADFGQYIVIDKGGIQSASSIHVKFINDETTFRFVYRVDGQPWWNNVLTPYKGSNTLSPFVVLS